MTPSDTPRLSRRSALRLSGLTTLGLTLSQWLPTHAQVPEPESAAPSAEDALRWLIEGNARWAAGQAIQPNQGLSRRAELTTGQQPFAIVVSCVDSRVPPELVFDRGIGDLFVIRTAAHVIDSAALGSIEFGAEELHIPLIMVLGHEKCGAVTAAVEAIEHHVTAPGHIDSLVEGIRPAVEATAGRPGDAVDNAVRANTIITVDSLRAAEPILTELGAHGNVRIVGARYDLTSGLIEMVA